MGRGNAPGTTLRWGENGPSIRTGKRASCKALTRGTLYTPTQHSPAVKLRLHDTKLSASFTSLMNQIVASQVPQVSPRVLRRMAQPERFLLDRKWNQAQRWR